MSVAILEGNFEGADTSATATSNATGRRCRRQSSGITAWIGVVVVKLLLTGDSVTRAVTSPATAAAFPSAFLVDVLQVFLK